MDYTAGKIDKENIYVLHCKWLESADDLQHWTASMELWLNYWDDL